MAERKCGSRRCVSFFLELISSIWQTLSLLIENLREIYWCEQKMRWDEVIRMGTCWGQVTAVLEIDIGPYIRPLTKRKYWESADRPDGKIDEEGTWNQSRYQRGKWPWWRGGSEKKILERDSKHGGDKKIMDKIGWKWPVGQAENEDLNARGVIERIGKERTAKIRTSRILLCWEILQQTASNQRSRDIRYAIICSSLYSMLTPSKSITERYTWQRWFINKMPKLINPCGLAGSGVRCKLPLKVGITTSPFLSHSLETRRIRD